MLLQDKKESGAENQGVRNILSDNAAVAQYEEEEVQFFQITP